MRFSFLTIPFLFATSYPVPNRRSGAAATHSADCSPNSGQDWEACSGGMGVHVELNALNPLTIHHVELAVEYL